MDLFYYDGEIYMGTQTNLGLPSESAVIVTNEALLCVINFIYDKNISNVVLSANDDRDFVFECKVTEKMIDNSEPICYNDQAEEAVEPKEKSNVTKIF